MRVLVAMAIGGLLIGGCGSPPPNSPPSTQANAVTRRGERDALRADLDALEKADNDAATKTVADALAGRVDINAPDADGRTPLECAISLGRIDLLDALLKRGASPSRADPNGVTPLMAAISARQQDATDELLKAGADVNGWNRTSHPWAPDGYTVLTDAIMDMNIVAVRELLDRGADPNLPDMPRCRPLDEAANAGPPEVLGMLLAHGAKFGPKEARDAMDIAIGVDRSDNLQFLISKGANVNARDEFGMTLLMFYCNSGGREDCLKALIVAGTDLNAKDKEGDTAMSIAVAADQPANVKLLAAAAPTTRP